MSEAAETTAVHAGDAGDVPPYRYTAAMAGEIEARWQDFWDENGTFHAPNPTGAAGRPRATRGPARRSCTCMDMFPYPSGRGPARRPPAGLHRHRLLRPVPADGRVQRAAPDGVRRVRPAGRAVRGADRHAPARSPPRRTSSGTAAQLRRLGLAHDDRRSCRHHRRRVLPLDAVDLPADLQLLVRRGRGAGPGRSTS